MTINALRICQPNDSIVLYKESETGSFNTGSNSGFLNSYSDTVDIGALDASFIFFSLSGGASYTALTAGVSAQVNNLSPSHTAFDTAWVTITAVGGYHFSMAGYSYPIRFVRFTKGTGNNFGADTGVAVFSPLCNYYVS